MKKTILSFCVVLLAPSCLLSAQANKTTTPLYKVNVVSRTTKAINYQQRGGPTKIGFQGTVLLPEIRGEATVDSRRGSTVIDAKLEKLQAPTRFGPEYLTYVMWAITPDGRAVNLGEIVANHSNKARLHASTEFQAFGLIVTAEPYFAVTQPSSVVVAENFVRPDTVGSVQEITARAEFLDRGTYNFDVARARQIDNQSGQKVSMDEYEAIVQLYQARNTVQLAQAAGAAEHAPDVLKKATEFLQQAEAAYTSRNAFKYVVSVARNASQTAEDARLLATKRQADSPAADNQ
jgi:hypothetical protein